MVAVYRLIFDEISDAIGAVSGVAGSIETQEALTHIQYIRRGLDEIAGPDPN